MSISVIPQRDSMGHPIGYVSPFASKEIDGKKLYKRVHGVVVDCSIGLNTFDLVIPYLEAKLNKIEIMWAPEECTADFKVYDTPTGIISTVPNYMLNQFGFGLGVAKDLHIEQSEYDADVIQDMKLSCELTTSTAKKICVNFILNELK